MTVTLSPKQFLRKQRIEQIANLQMENDLVFLDAFNVTYTDAVSVTYLEDLTTAGDDISSEVMGEPLELGELSELSEVEISPITQQSGMLRPFGAKIKVSERDMNRSEYVNELQRAVTRLGYAMARKVNNDIVSAFQNKTNDITEVSGGAVWSADTADPIRDIGLFKKAFHVDGFDSMLTDLYVYTDNFYEFEDHMISIDRSWAVNPRGTERVPNIRGVNIHEVMDINQVAEGSYLGFDMRPAFKPMEIYAYRPEGYSTAPNFRMINVNQYKEPNHPRNTVTEFVAESLYTIKKPNSFCYKSSGI